MSRRAWELGRPEFMLGNLVVVVPYTITDNVVRVISGFTTWEAAMRLISSDL
jgi:hypothetical protein